MQRRTFLQTAGAAAAAVAGRSAARGQSALERVRFALIGCGGRGRFVAGHMRQVPNTELVAVCDVYERNREQARQWAGGACRAEKDFRRLLDRPDIDAVLVATPDHWHATIAILACQAGKDVYVEKPLAHNIREGQWIVRAARQHQRVVQVGTQQRAAAHFQQMQEIVQSGQLGPIHLVRIWNYRNIYPNGIGRPADTAFPAGLDWDFYLGPAPKVPFHPNRFLRNFRWFWDYAGGIITDWGTHRFDSMRQVLGVDAPLAVSAAGGRFELDDGGEVPDTMQVTYEFPGLVVSYEASALNAHGGGWRTPQRAYYRANGLTDRPNGLAFYGTEGTLLADRLGFEILPELAPGKRLPRNHQGPVPAGTYRMARQEGSSPDSTYLHAEDFINCVRSRQRPRADVEVGHRSTLVAHLGNIAYHTGHKIRWDSEQETIVDDPEAARWLYRPPRPEWDWIGA